ncbi:MAG: GNAT family N-acetyltransferase [Ramlibacter sp.]
MIPSMPSLDNVFWRSLSGPHRHLSAGTATARRYAAGYSPIVAFADARHPDLAALAPFCAPGERFYCADWDGPAPAGWQVELEARMMRMAWNGGMPADDAALAAVQLGPRDADAAVALAALTRPGPFGPRTLEMGDYFGVFDGGRLVTMAGERTCAEGAREVSGVCTHPEYQGRGLARRLMQLLIRRQLARGELPFLHVMSANSGARGLYERMGFRDDAECVVRVITRAT